MFIMLRSIPLILLLWSQVFWYECRSSLECLSLLHFNAVLAVHCPSACFSISHSENIVSLDSAVCAAVSWDGLSKLRCFIVRYFNSVEKL